MHKIYEIFKKELKRVFSDKKIMFNLFVLPLISLTVIYSVLGIFLINSMTDTSEHQSIIYQQNMPTAIMAQFSEMDIELKSVDQMDINDISEQIKVGEADLLVVFSKDFETQISNAAIPSITTYYNESEDYSSKAYNQFTSVMSAYEKSVLAIRLGGLERLTVFSEDTIQLAKENLFIIKMISGLVTMMIVLFIFAGSMQQGIDTIAGEKERGSLATLLMTPTDRKLIAIGKISGLSVIAITSSIVTFFGIVISLLINKFYLASRSADFSTGIDEGISTVFSSLQFGFGKVIMLLVIMMMTAFISASLICLLSSRSKTSKEAGTLISPFYIIIMIAAYIPYITQETPKLFSYFIPLYGNVASIYSLFEGTLTFNNFIIGCAMTIFYALIFVYFTAKSFENEKYMF